MPEPDPPHKNITADGGFARMLDIMHRWAPLRLYHTGQARKGIRALTKGGR
jgi:hypothetical protein